MVWNCNFQKQEDNIICKRIERYAHGIARNKKEAKVFEPVPGTVEDSLVVRKLFKRQQYARHRQIIKNENIQNAYNIVFLFLEIAVSVTIAILLNDLRKKRVNKTLQTMMFLPYFVSWVVVASIAYSLFNFENGTVNGVIEALGGDKYCLSTAKLKLQWSAAAAEAWYEKSSGAHSTTNVGMAAAAGLYQSVMCFVFVMVTNACVKKIQPDYALF